MQDDTKVSQDLNAIKQDIWLDKVWEIQEKATPDSPAIRYNFGIMLPQAADIPKPAVLTGPYSGTELAKNSQIQVVGKYTYCE
jgi:hypothetical protein